MSCRILDIRTVPRKMRISVLMKHTERSARILLSDANRLTFAAGSSKETDGADGP